MIRAISYSAFASAAIALAAAAQTPFVPHSDLWVTDSNNDRVVRVADLNYDGDYDDAAEVSVFFDNTGAFSLSNNVGITTRPDGTVFVSDTSTDVILTLRDLDGNGDALGINESVLYYQSATNAELIIMDAANNLYLDGNVTWVAVAGSSSGHDCILRLEDLNADGDAMDAGESLEYLVRPGTAALPQDVRVGPDGNVYYLEIAASAYPKGIYKLVDLDSNGTIDPVLEAFPFFIPTGLAASAFYWSIDLDADGYWYMADTGNDVIWRGKDLDGNGTIDIGTEGVVWWTSPAASLIWRCNMGTDGNLYVSESQNNERIFLMHDDDNNGVIDPVLESKKVYDELTTLGTPIGQIRGFALDAHFQNHGETYCVGQVNSLGCLTTMSFEGWPSASYGSGYLLHTVNTRNQQNGVMFYGINGRFSAPFNGGTMCVANPRVRTGVRNSGGSPAGVDDCTGAFTMDFNAWIAGGLDPSLVEGVVVDAQYWSRDPDALPGNTNLSDAVEFTILR